MHSKYAYRPIPNISPATKIRLREHFTAEIFYRRKYPELRYLEFLVVIKFCDYLQTLPYKIIIIITGEILILAIEVRYMLEWYALWPAEGFWIRLN